MKCRSVSTAMITLASFLALTGAETSGITSGAIYRLTAKCSGKALTVVGGGLTDGTLVSQSTDSSATSQQWRLEYQPDGSYRVTSVLSSKLLEISGSSLVDGGQAQQWSVTGAANQKWIVSDGGGGWFKLTAMHSGKCLDVNGSSGSDGAKVQQWTDNGSAAQRWRFELQDIAGSVGPLVSAGTYRWTAKHSGKVLDVASGSTVDGGNIQQYQDNASTAQRWLLQSSGVDYRFEAKCSGKVMEVAGASTANGGNVQQFTDSGAASQRWNLATSGSNWFKVSAKHSGKYLDVSGVSTANGANVHQWSSSTGDNQLWKPTPSYDVTLSTTPVSIVVAVGDLVKVTPQVTGTVTAYESCGVATIAPFGVTSGTSFLLPTSTPGYYTYRATNTSGVELGVIEIDVVRTTLSEVPLACEIGFTRAVTVTVEPAGAPVSFRTTDLSQLSVGVPSVNNTQVTFLVKRKVAGTAYLIATIPGIGGSATIARRPLEGFTLETQATSFVPVIATFSDGSQLGQTNLVMAPLISYLSVTMTCYSSGLTFDDSTTITSFLSSTFSPSGTNGLKQYRLIRAPTGFYHWCHTWTAYQSGVQVSRTH